MNRRQKKKREQKRLNDITAYVKDALAAGSNTKKETDQVVNTTKALAGRRKQCLISKWVLQKR